MQYVYQTNFRVAFFYVYVAFIIKILLHLYYILLQIRHTFTACLNKSVSLSFKVVSRCGNTADALNISNKADIACLAGCFLGDFAKLWKVTVSFVMSVLPSVCRQQLDSHWKDFNKFWYLMFFRKPVEEIQFSLNLEGITCTFLDVLTFMTVYR